MKRGEKPRRTKPKPAATASRPEARRPSVDRLLTTHLPGLTAFVRLKLGPLIRANESCADIVQSACREVLVHADRFQFDGAGNFRHWLFTTALRKITDRKRFYLADKRRAPPESRRAGAATGSADSVADCYQTAFTSPTQAAMRREEVDALERAFDRLSTEDREVVVLARIVGMTAAEIAKETDQRPGAVRQRLSRALVRLAVLMGAKPKSAG